MIRRHLLVYVMFFYSIILTLASGGSTNEDDSKADDVSCPLGPKPTEVVEMITRYVSSSEYIAECASEMISEDEFEGIIAGLHRAGMGVRIRQGDYIITKGVDTYEEILDRIWVSEVKDGPDFRNLLQQTIVDLYFLLIETTQMSDMESSEARNWGAALAQVHYRIVAGVASHRWDDIDSFSAELREPMFVILDAAKRSRSLAPRVHQPEAFVITAAVVAPIVLPVIARAGCWCLGRCVDWYRSTHSTTTTTELPSTTVAPTTVDPTQGVRKKHRKMFFKTSNAYLDEIVKILGYADSTSEDGWSDRLAVVKKMVNKRIMEIASGIAVAAPGSDSVDVIRLAFEVPAQFSQFSGVKEDWPSFCARISKTVNLLRNELLRIVLESI